MENEIMNIEEVEVMDCNAELVEDSKPGISTGAAVLIGAAVTCGVIAAVKGVKKAWAKHKAKKGASQQESVEVEAEIVEEA